MNMRSISDGKILLINNLILKLDIFQRDFVKAAKFAKLTLACGLYIMKAL